MKRFSLLLTTLFLVNTTFSQSWTPGIDSFHVYGDVKVTWDRPVCQKNKKTILVFFALPNGNTTDQTMGKLMQPGDDWHFDIQHIRAQTDFIRQQMAHTNLVVVYLESAFKSWPAWKQKHPDYAVILPHLVDSLKGLLGKTNVEIDLNGHSGGGSFIFGYLAGVKKIPSAVKRISFLDSDYGYDSSYYPKIKAWLLGDRQTALTVFAYNDSVALYNGKPIVSATGGTWYRSRLLLRDLEQDLDFIPTRQDSVIGYSAKKGRVQFLFRTNPDRKIFHTQQVEFNGFIHSILCGTPYESKKYSYFGPRAYNEFIQ